MEFEHTAIALLASMILVLAGMVGWLYWQQTRILQNMNNIVVAVGELATTRGQPEEVEDQEEEPTLAVVEPTPAVEETDEEDDDRASVDKTEAVIVDGPPATSEDTDDFDGKTKKELQEILTKRGIPYGKADTKPALITLLKVTA